MKKKNWIFAAIAVCGVVLAVWLWNGRGASEADGPEGGKDAVGEKVAAAAVVPVQLRSVGSTLTIAGEFKAFQDVEMHAKVAGYIRKIYVDVGDHVKEGQVIAVLEVPELAAQLSGSEAAVRGAQEQINRAQGEVERQKSTHAAVHSAFVRLKQAADARAGLVAQQEIDDAQAKDLESEGHLSSAQAELEAAKQQLEVSRDTQKQALAQSNYTRIVAPFAGVITSRTADTGTLVSAGTSGGSQSIPVVRLAQISTLRLVLPIPESMATQVQLGQAVQVRVQALGRDIVGKVSRFADSLDMQTRTMQTEIDVDNRDGKLMPGMYTETKLALQKKENALTVPLEAVARAGDDATVLAVNPQNVVNERHVKLGVEDNAYVEVLSGLSDGDRVVIGNRGAFHDGEKVDPKNIDSHGAASGGASSASGGLR